MSIEDRRTQEIAEWNEREQRLLKRRDTLVILSIPGWTATVCLLPKFIQVLNTAIENPGITEEHWIFKTLALAVLVGWGVFEGAEYTEEARLAVLETLDRNGVDVADRVYVGRFPWVKHFVDNEQVTGKVIRWVRGLSNKE